MEKNYLKKTIGIVSISLVFVLVGCATTPTQQPSTVPISTVEVSPTSISTPTSSPSEEAIISPPETSGDSVVAMLEQLVIQPENGAGEYNRDYFKHWITQPDGCNTRSNVLQRDAVIVSSVNDCSVQGEWFSIYDNKVTSDSGTFDIDHLVPLAEAWRSGANNWDNATREAFANDLSYVYSLIAVSAGSNRSKGDKDPANWMPPTMDGCDYVGRWVGVKYRWNLSVDQREHDKILSVLAWCDGDYVLPSVPAPANVIIGGGSPPVQESTVPVTTNDEIDPRFKTCKEAKSNGFGPYVHGVDAEYDWYRDGDSDGTVCE